MPGGEVICVLAEGVGRRRECPEPCLPPEVVGWRWLSVSMPWPGDQGAVEAAHAHRQHAAAAPLEQDPSLRRCCLVLQGGQSANQGSVSRWTEGVDVSSLHTVAVAVLCPRLRLVGLSWLGWLEG
jgi:hypothetical protein